MYLARRTTEGTPTERCSERKASSDSCKVSTFSASTKQTARRALTTVSGSNVAFRTNTLGMAEG
jgi:hypothetical protein